ncbi:FtsK/SpoIIIE domain-containing protein [Mycolicibacterium poriferae]|uniref:FtsK/SpoIIIE domain-containing protein n=1 Tax=Mycolicibacterium poriferae TaxID=39694 RepID=UPI00321A196B
MISSVRERGAELSREIDRVAEAIDRCKAEREEDFRSRAAEIRTQSEQFRQSAFRDIDDRAAAERAAAVASVEAAVRTLAPGCAGAGWTDSWDVSGAHPVLPRHLRVGRLRSEGVPAECDVPALAPLMLSTGWSVHADAGHAAGLVQGAVLRLVACAPLRHLRIHVFDPRIRGTLGVFAGLRSASAASLPPAIHTSGQLREVLDDLTRSAAANAELIGSRHLADLGALWQVEGVPTGDASLMVILDYPTGVDQAAQEQLLRLAGTGPARGVSLIVVHDADSRAERGVKPKALARSLTAIEYRDGSWLLPALPAGSVGVDEGPPPASIIEPALAEAARAASDMNGPVITLSELIDEYTARGWRETSDDEIEAIIGRQGRDRLAISLRSENPPQPNVLIGGAVGQGKSNLLLDIIYSLAARYGPDQLEMLLLDFKQGLEFKRFDADDSGRNWLPHARVLCLESNKAFGLSVLEYVNAEMIRRAELFTRTRCNGFTAYRSTTGEPMRRLLLIVDEFQVLFDGHDDMTTEAVRLFETIAKQGRAYGIHILLSSQTVSGISGLQVKGDSIFAQFPIRISLKNTREESEAILARHNTAAADLSYRGEVIVNRNLGMAGDGANVRGIAAYAEPDHLTELQAELWGRAADGGEVVAPWVFMGRSYAQWPAQAINRASPRPVGWLGRPLTITDQPVTVDFADGADRGVALVGGGDDVAAAVLGALTVTATAGWSADARPSG